MDYLTRLVDGQIDTLLAELPAIFITGPRATGKTTTAARRAATIVRLDREAEAVAVRADPDAALRGFREPILLDEWQVVPGVLGAVKRAVDADPRPGRFLITGSVRGDLGGELWPGTGRLTRVPMFGMTVREQAGLGSRGVPFLDRVVSGANLLPAVDTPDLRGYLELALRGGFPEPALRLGETARRAWLESYVEHLLTRDAEQVDGGRDPVRLRRYLEAYALNTAGIVDERTLFEAAGINRRTAQAYERLLTNLLVVEALPAWTSNRLKRLVLMPKRHLIDPALAGAVLGLDANLVLREGDLLGRLLDTFVVAQLRAELAVTAARPRLYHVRQQQGRLEVDLLAELAGGRLVAIEVKADAAPSADAARHLATLRDRYPETFTAGVVLHTGPRTYRLGDRIVAAPISSLWG
ncbi:MAG: ATP-binding protein [Chloroflexi bacterium RBG_16_72_14]|nr:MAG: ATP-binding protein [Chloroflexi bacterium RBG_16_72_14]